jgi:Tfp pilus assembly protein FimT
MAILLLLLLIVLAVLAAVHLWLAVPHLPSISSSSRLRRASSSLESHNS